MHSRTLFAVTAIAATSTHGANAQEFNGFATERELLAVLGIRPVAMTTADINGDGALDLIVANFGPFDTDPLTRGNITVLSDVGIGFAVSQTLEAPLLSGPFSLDVRDIDDDGYLDLIVGDRLGDEIGPLDENVFVFNGTRTGLFDDTAFPFPAGQQITDVEIGLVDDDGVLDVMTAHDVDTGGNSSLLTGNGDGTFNPAVEFVFGTLDIREIGLVDFNGDGLLDIAKRDGQLVIEVVPGISNGQFDYQQAVQIGGAEKTNSMVVGDVNNDNDEDIVVGSSTAFVEVRENLGGFSFALEGFDLHPTNTVGTVDLQDAGGDGYPEILVSHSDDEAENDVSVLVSDGTGSYFTVPIELTLDPVTYAPSTGLGDGPSSAFDITAVDFDGDGDKDILILVQPDVDAGSQIDPDVTPGVLVTFRNVLIDLFLSPPIINQPDESVSLGFVSNPECFTPDSGITFSWFPPSVITEPLTPIYTFRIASDPLFQNIEFESAEMTTTSITLSANDLQLLTVNTTHYWSVEVTNGAGAVEASSGPIFTNPNRADISGDGVVNGVDLASLLAIWPEEDPSDFPAGVCADFNLDGLLDGNDLAFLLANWSGGAPVTMGFGNNATPNDMSGELVEDADAPMLATSDVSWIIAHFGFTNESDYASWVDLLSPEMQAQHFLDIIQLVQGQ